MAEEEEVVPLKEMSLRSQNRGRTDYITAGQSEMDRLGVEFSEPVKITQIDLFAQKKKVLGFTISTCHTLRDIRSRALAYLTDLVSRIYPEMEKFRNVLGL
ncbi:hypothetical protein JTE90_026707 [Oedothorax gibbosus]|uniref:Uncharacterized protein n=1 Tax=Oedothorax gibbosus TaxID=931172 RepID=A0AAV6V0M6_9ARAC|nr:hypothetical protein JTE90_026707 [Oedothorax gibbosus]